MNIFQSMLNKKNQKVYDQICNYVDSYMKAKNGKKPERAVVKKDAFMSVMKDVEKYCQNNNKTIPERIFVGGVEICHA